MLKRYKHLFIGIVIGIIITAIPVGSTIQQYTLSQSTVKFIIDGEEYKNDTLPILLMQPGYNYIPAAAFRDISKIIGADFWFDSKTNTINIKTNSQNETAPTKQPTPTPTPKSATEISFKTINEPHPNLQKLLIDENIKSTNMNSRWYDENDFTGSSMISRKLDVVAIEFNKNVDINEVYTYCEGTVYKIEFIDRTNNSYYILFPTVDMVNKYYDNFGKSTLNKNRCSIDLKNITKINITIEQLLRSHESSAAIEELNDFLREIEFNGRISD